MAAPAAEWKPRVKRGRRFYMEELTTDLDGRTWWWWCTWRLFERMSGSAPSEADAAAAVEHFLESPGASYTL